MKLEASGEISQMPVRTVTRNGTTYEQNTANIGTRRVDAHHVPRDASGEARGYVYPLADETQQRRTSGVSGHC